MFSLFSLFPPLSLKSLYILLCSFTVTLNIHKNIHNPSGKLINEEYLCTGVFVSDTDILTAAHCLENAASVWIKTSNGHGYPAQIVTLDPDFDLGLIRVTKPSPHSIVVLGNLPSITDSVYAVNSGAGYEWTWGAGIIENHVHYEEDGPWMEETSIPIQQGASGGGFYNREGKLVGISVLTSNNGNSLAVALDTVHKFLAHAPKGREYAPRS